MDCGEDHGQEHVGAQGNAKHSRATEGSIWPTTISSTASCGFRSILAISLLPLRGSSPTKLARSSASSALWRLPPTAPFQANRKPCASSPAYRLDAFGKP